MPELDMASYRKRYEVFKKKGAALKAKSVLENASGTGIANVRLVSLSNGEYQLSWAERIDPIPNRGLGG